MDQHEPPHRLVGTGLGLFGLRGIPFIGREEERDLLWAALRDVAAEGGTQVVHISSDTGAGATRLVDAMITRALELGIATALRADHSSMGGPGEGFKAMVHRALNTRDLSPQEFATTAEAIDGTAGRELTALIHPNPAHAVPGPRQRAAILSRWIDARAARQPAILWLDDAQWSPEALRLATTLLTSPGENPVLVVLCTHRDLPLDDEVGALLEEINAHERCRRLSLGPLPDDDYRRLIEAMLPLSPTLCDLLVTRTEGVPLYAAQILGAWIEQGRLVPTPHGFELCSGTEEHLPSQMRDFWLDRLGTLLASLPGADEDALWHAFRLGALLGPDIARPELEVLAATQPIEAPERLLEILIARGLARRTSSGWAFARKLVAVCIQEDPRVRDELPELHRICAEVLTQAYDDPEVAALRRANHWLEGGDLDRAIEALAVEQRRLLRLEEHILHRQVLQKMIDALQAAHVPENDPRLLDAQIQLAANLVRRTADCAELDTRVSRLAQLALADGDFEHFAQASLVRVQTYRNLNQPLKARQIGEEALAIATPARETKSYARLLITHGWTLRSLGEFDEAEANLSTLSSDNLGPRLGMIALQLQAALSEARGDEDRAEELYNDLLTRARSSRLNELHAYAINGLGELARRRDLDQARAHFLELVTIGAQAGLTEAEALGYINLLLVDLQQDRPADARRALSSWTTRFGLVYGAFYHPYLRGIRLTLAADAGDWAGFDELLTPLLEAGTDHVDRDLVWLLRDAARRAEIAHQPHRAEQTRAVADRIAEKLQRQGD